MSDRDTETYNREIEYRASLRREIARLRRELRASDKRVAMPLPLQTAAIMEAEKVRGFGLPA